ncbi:MAG: sigma 54-interacting transcriptional regulator [Pyrinomonadaceae bacterium]
MPDGKKKRRVLHVPDGDGRLLTELLTSDGHEVTEADGTSPVLDCAARGQFDLVVVEHHSPAGAALRTLMARHQALLDATPDAVFLLTHDGTFLDYHAKDPGQFLVPPERFLSKNVRDVLPQGLAADLLRCFERALESGSLVTHEYTLPAADGPGAYEATVVGCGEHKVLSIVRDVTERRRAEEAVRERDRLLQTIFDSLSSHVAVLDRAGVITYVSRAWEEFAGRNQGLPERIGVGVDYVSVCRAAQTGDPTVREALGGIEAVMAGERPTYSIEYPCHSPAERRWFLMQVDPMPPEQGGVVISHVNITERKRAEEALRESEEFNRRIVESSGDCIKLLDPEGRLLYISERGQELLGIEDPGPYLNGSWVGLWPGEGQRDARAAIEQAKASGFGVFQAFGPTPRGEPKWWDTVVTPMTDARGRVTRLLAISRDITESKRAEEALKGALAEVRQLKDRLQEENVYLREEIKLESNITEVVGGSDATRHVLHKVERVAPTDSTVLITGETGTGKERVAHAVHKLSGRRDSPFIKVNCAALSPTLIESELFGHERGAFTGAVAQRRGRFELADGATLFLDEIGELPIELQPKLLRVLQDGEFERLGGTKTIKADARVIAATNRDLRKEVQAGRFRADLYYRLNVYPITVPPLRERREDIQPLVEHFVGIFSRKMGKEITSVASATLEMLRSYLWPGNVRELANVIERAVITTPGAVLHISNLTEASPAAAPPKPSMTLEEVEREHIAAVLESTNRKIDGPDGAARILGLNPSTLRTRMNKLGIQSRKPWPPPRSR